MRVAKIALDTRPFAIGRKLKLMSRRGCDRFYGRSALKRFPKPGENVAEIIAAFQHPVQTAQRGLDEREMRRNLRASTFCELPSDAGETAFFGLAADRAKMWLGAVGGSGQARPGTCAGCGLTNGR